MIPLRFIRALGLIIGLAAGVCSAHAAGDLRPMVGPGATKDDVINAYGWPNGQSQSGTKEILSYSQGEVVLENGRVERVNFSPDVPWQTPKPRPGAPTASTRKEAEAPPASWLTSFGAAQAEAQRRRLRMLALFTGSDWSPASREFHDQIENNPDFINAFVADFVLLKLDFPRGAPIAAKISEENLKLRERYHVTVYPTLLVLSPSGEQLGQVDLTSGSPAQPYRDRVIAAVRGARDAWPLPVPAATVAEPARATAPASVPAAAGTTPSTKPGVPVAPQAVPTPSGALPVPASAPPIRGMRSAVQLVVLALLVGGVIIAFLLWSLWRRPKGLPAANATEISNRISAAAGGLPSVAEMSAWSRDKLCAITAALAEFDNYTAHVRPAGGDVDIELRKRGDLNPRVLVCCVNGAEGIVPAKRVRELFGTLAAEGGETGWVVSPVGFSPETRDYAAAHQIVLIGSDGLHTMMREVPPVSLPGILAQE